MKIALQFSTYSDAEHLQGDTELELLVLAMQKHFSNKCQRWRKNPALVAPGELMVLLEGKPENPDCSRVLVLEVDDCRDDECRVKVRISRLYIIRYT